MSTFQFNIDVIHTVNDDIWIATSDDIRGLTVESEGLANFLADIVEVSVELLTHNHGVSEKQLNKTNLHCHVKHELGDNAKNTLPNPESRIAKLQLAAA